MKKTILVSFFFFLSTLLFSKSEVEQVQPNHIEIATIMFYDGKYDKALKELRLAKKEQKEIDWSKYYSMQGMIYLKKEKYPTAIKMLKRAILETQKKVYTPPKIEEEKAKYLFSFFSTPKKKLKKKAPTFNPEKLRKDTITGLYIYLSQAYYRNKQYLNTVYALNKAGKKGRDKASLFTLRAECYWKAGKKGKAISTLTKGSRLFPKDTTLIKQKYYHFAELGLYQSAIATAKAYMRKLSKKDVTEYTSLAQMLSSAGQEMEAIKILEEAKLLFPRSAKVTMLLGYLYNKKEMPNTTADLFEYSSYFDKKYTKEAAEMYRRNGELSHALYLNTKMSDKVEKIKQKVAIYVDRGEFEKVVGLKNAMGRYGILEDDNMRYALAYAYYIIKDYKEAEIHLKKINDNELFSKATIIRKNIEKCKNNSLECI